MPGESYCRGLRSLLLYLCYVFWVLINSLVRWFCTSTVGLVLFRINELEDWKRSLNTRCKNGSPTLPSISWPAVTYLSHPEQLLDNAVPNLAFDFMTGSEQIYMLRMVHCFAWCLQSVYFCVLPDVYSQCTFVFCLMFTVSVLLCFVTVCLDVDAIYYTDLFTRTV